MADNAETAILAGGCFWITQQLLRDRDGVISTRVGWTGGENDNPTEENNCGHAEAVEVVFDPARISYRDLLELFFQVHRPDLGEDLVGSSYRSEIFYMTDEQRDVAEETIPDVEASGHWPGKVVTRISEAGPFWEADAEDQDYFQRYPDDGKVPFPRPGVEAGDRSADPLQDPEEARSSSRPLRLPGKEERAARWERLRALHDRGIALARQRASADSEPTAASDVGAWFAAWPAPPDPNRRSAAAGWVDR